jgi:hypothetical protein
MNKITNAGCLFTNYNHVLAGYQPKKKIPFISGFGGKKLSYETIIETAIRETIEELFDINYVPFELIYRIKKINPTKVIMQDNYLLFVYSFEQLLDILHISKEIISTYIYLSFPTTVHDLIFNRIINNKSEVSQLCLLPYTKNIKIDPIFILDINLI